MTLGATTLMCKDHSQARPDLSVKVNAVKFKLTSKTHEQRLQQMQIHQICKAKNVMICKACGVVSCQEFAVVAQKRKEKKILCR